MNYLLDTDIGPDCDDAAALALAVLYARKYGGRLLAVTHCTSSPWGVGAIRRVLQWYGAEAEVGTLTDAGFLTAPEMEKYNRALALSVSPAEREAGDATAVLRRALSGQPDGSVQIVGIGPMRNLRKLLESGADALSPLNGRELIARKVARLTVMAGANGGARMAGRGRLVRLGGREGRDRAARAMRIERGQPGAAGVSALVWRRWPQQLGSVCGAMGDGRGKRKLRAVRPGERRNRCARRHAMAGAVGRAAQIFVPEGSAGEGRKKHGGNAGGL